MTPRLLGRSRVVLSYGMGADSTALLLRWIREPDTRPCDLTDLLVITAMTGDEWPATGRLVAEHILPRLREHGIRWVQVARAAAGQADGITILDDSRAPSRVHLGGAYRLSDEMLAAGTVPQVAGSRKCSAKAKGWVLDKFLSAEMSGQRYLHVIGFEAGETGRARRDAGYNDAQRTGSYPLIAWGWDRQTCEDYIRSVTGADWPKSACTYCPFALCNKDGRERVLAAYRAEPNAGVQALVLEHIAVSLNPRQGLAAGERLSGLLAASGQHHDVLDAFTAELGQMPWKVYDVRRVIRPRADDPAKAANASRSVRAVASGSRDQMTAVLRDLAHAAGTEVGIDDGIERVWLRHRGTTLPAAEHFLVAAPAGPEDKEGPGFQAAWQVATASVNCDPAGQMLLPLNWATAA
jgi:hypothetical protein